MFGEFAQLPCVHEHEKTYWVTVEGDPAQDKLAQLERGIQLKEYWTLPATVRLIPSPSLLPRPKPVTPHGLTAWIEIKLREGKKRQIRHTLTPRGVRCSAGVTAVVGLFTLRLVRVAIGAVRLGDLKAGEWRELSAPELNRLKSNRSIIIPCMPAANARSCLGVWRWSFFLPVQADPMHQPAPQINGYDLINAVNALRAAYGLPPYSINSTLMFTAQNQADFMAASGQVTHSGPGGITLTQRLLAAGYPLAGDLSLGGFRAENITSGSETMAAESAIQGWMRDAPHQNTMLSPNLTEIGAGVAIANGRAYLVIDAARPTNAPNPPLDATSVVGSGTIVPAVEAPIVPVTLSTPNASGEVLHEVQYGQSLWQLAISYGVRIDDIKRLNGLFDNSIFPGNILLIKLVPTAAPSPLTETAVATITPHPTMAATVTPVFVAHLTATSMPPAVQDSTSRMSWAIGIIALALFGAGMFAWLGGRSNHSKNR